MSCVVAIRKKGKLYFGCDTAVSISNRLETSSESKIFKYGKRFLIGAVGLSRESQIVEHIFKPPTHPKSMSIMKYFVGRFIPRLIQSLIIGGRISEGGDYEWSGILLVGYRNRLFVVDNAFSVIEYDKDNYAIGSGEQYAMGSLLSTDSLPTKERIDLALNAACIDDSVAPPFKYEIL